MATTTNFGWETPDDTDLVKDGAAAMRTLGNSIDTSFVDLKGGTTGQVLSKASGTDLDFTWVTDAAGDITGVTAGTGISGGGTSGTVTVTNSMATAITTAGDLIKGTGSGTFDRLGIGTTGQVLTVAAGAPTWATPAAGGGGKVLQVVGATYSTETTTASTTYADTGLTATITPTLSTSKILVLVSQSIAIETSSSASDVGGAVRLLRGATGIFNNAADYQTSYWTGVSGTFFIVNYTNIMYLDSPATTSATTYKTQQRSYDTANGEKIKSQVSGNATSTITLLEIGA